MKIKSIRIEGRKEGQGIRRYGTGGHESAGKVVLTTLEEAEKHIPCGRLHCHKGGYRLMPIIDRMCRSEETEFEDLLVCEGYEGSPGGGRTYKDCTNTFEVKIQITYDQ